MESGAAAAALFAPVQHGGRGSRCKVGASRCFAGFAKDLEVALHLEVLAVLAERDARTCPGGEKIVKLGDRVARLPAGWGHGDSAWSDR